MLLGLTERACRRNYQHYAQPSAAVIDFFRLMRTSFSYVIKLVENHCPRRECAQPIAAGFLTKNCIICCLAEANFLCHSWTIDMPREEALTESMSSVAQTSRHYSHNVSDVWLTFANRGEARPGVQGGWLPNEHHLDHQGREQWRASLLSDRPLESNRKIVKRRT
jgi:hypothetical protein